MTRLVLNDFIYSIGNIVGSGILPEHFTTLISLHTLFSSCTLRTVWSCVWRLGIPGPVLPLCGRTRPTDSVPLPRNQRTKEESTVISRWTLHLHFSHGKNLCSFEEEEKKPSSDEEASSSNNPVKKIWTLLKDTFLLILRWVDTLHYCSIGNLSFPESFQEAPGETSGLPRPHGGGLRLLHRRFESPRRVRPGSHLPKEGVPMVGRGRVQWLVCRGEINQNLQPVLVQLQLPVSVPPFQFQANTGFIKLPVPLIIIGLSKIFHVQYQQNKFWTPKVYYSPFSLRLVTFSFLASRPAAWLPSIPPGYQLPH